MNGAHQLDEGGLYFGVSGGPGENIFYYPGLFYEVQADNVHTAYAATFVATQAPEIDPSSAAGGLALLVGGLIVLSGRKRRGVAA